MMAGIGSFFTAFSYQPVIYPVYLSLSNRTLQRGSYVNHLACLLVFVVYLSTSILGLAAYPNSNLNGDILSTMNQ